jgi:anti-sigma factor RsiW
MDARHDNDLEMLLSAYRDGELSPDERAVVEEALHSDPKLQARLSDHEALSGLMRATLEQEADQVDFSGFADAVMARLPAARPSLWARFTVWVDEMLTYHRWQAASGLSVAVVLLVAGPLIWNATKAPSGAMQGPLLAGGPGLSTVIDVATPEDTDAMLFKTASGTTVIYVQGH